MYFRKQKMADDDPLFNLDVVRDFIIANGGKVKNHQLVSHFKTFLNDPRRKGKHGSLQDQRYLMLISLTGVNFLQDVKVRLCEKCRYNSKETWHV